MSRDGPFYADLPLNEEVLPLGGQSRGQRGTNGAVNRVFNHIFLLDYCTRHEQRARSRLVVEPAHTGQARNEVGVERRLSSSPQHGSTIPDDPRATNPRARAAAVVAAARDGAVELAPQRGIDEADDAASQALDISAKSWRWRHTTSYYISISFIIGSMLFIVGCSFDIARTNMNGSMRASTINWPFFWGSLMYTVGSYFGYLEVINAGWEHDDIRLFRRYDDSFGWDSYWGYMMFLIGANLFNINVITVLIDPMARHLDPKLFVWAVAVLACLCFVAGSIIEVRHNGGLWNFKDLAWHISIHNLLGSIFFTIAATSGLIVGDSLEFVKVPYLVGSLLFLSASTMQIWLWKREKYGLALARQLNIGVPQRTEQTSKEVDTDIAANEEPAQGLVGLKDVLFIILYCFGLSLAIVDLIFSSLCVEPKLGYTNPRFVLDNAVIAGLFAVVLVLMSIVHREPSLRPFTVLMWCLRIMMAIFAWDKLWEFVNWMKYDGCGEKEHFGRGLWPRIPQQ